MMMRTLLPALAAALLLSACGYKGDLYLPREGDKNKFGPVQTGLTKPEFKKRPAIKQPEKTASEPAPHSENQP